MTSNVSEVVVKYATKGVDKVKRANKTVKRSTSRAMKYANDKVDQFKKAMEGHSEGLATVESAAASAWSSMVKHSDKLNDQTNRINESFGEVWGTLGDQLAPAVSVLADGVENLANMFVSLPGPVKTIIAVGIALVAGLFSLVSIVAALIPALSALSAAAGALSAGLGTVAAAASAMLGPILLVVGAAALLYLAWKNNLFGIQDIAKQAFAGIKKLFNQLVGFVKPFWDKFLGDALAGRWKEALKTVLQFFVSIYAKLVKLWMSLGVKIGAAVAKLGAKIQTGIETALTKAVNGVKRAMNGIIAAFENGFNKALGGLNNFIGEIESGVNDAIRALNKLPEVNLGTVSLGQVGGVSLGRLDTESNAQIEQRAERRLEQRLSIIESRKQQGLSAIESAEQQIMPEFLQQGPDSSGKSGGDTHNVTEVQLQPGAVQVQGSGDSEADMEYAAQKASKIIGEQVGSRGGVQ